MTRRAKRLLGGVLALSSAAAGAWAQAPARVVADLAMAPISSRPWPLVKLNGRVLFGADSTLRGRELWSTDGTAVGTALVREVRPGSGSGLSIYSTDGLLALFDRLGPETGGVVLFAADDGVHGVELWSTDGTAAGTVLVKDINPGPASSRPQVARVEGGAVYFIADDGARGLEPWRTDGTPDGTTLVADVTPGPGGSQARVIAVDALGYYLSSTSTPGIWKKNFALPSPVRLHDFGVEDGRWILHEGALLFAGRSAADGEDLFRSGGTPGTTAVLSNIAAGVASSFPQGFTAYNGQVYFVAQPGGTPTLFRTDGTAAGTTGLTAAPWGTRLQTILGVHDGRMIFQIADTTGRAPSVALTDTTSAGTTLLTSVLMIRPLTAGPYNAYSASVEPGENGSLYVRGSLNPINTFVGPQVFRYPGTGITLTPATASATGPAAVAAYTVLGGRVVMAGEDAAGDVELWAAESAGSLASTRLADLHAGNTGSAIAWLRAVGPRLFFLDRIDTFPSRLFSTEGTPGTTLQFGAAGPDVFEENELIGPAVLGSTLFYEHRTPGTMGTGLELWATDGTAAGTRLVRDITPGTASSEIDQLRPAGGLMYFRRTNADGGTEIWRTDGSIAPDATLALTPATGAFSNLAAAGGGLMFVGRQFPADPPGLWRTDGTPAGTARVKAFASLSIGGTPITAVEGVGAAGGEFRAFFASGPLSPEGRELWVSDGTEAGTSLVADITPGPQGARPSQVVSAGVGAAGEPRVLFVAATPGEGAELWFSDGTGAGTRRVKDLRPGPPGSSIALLSAVVSPAPGAPVRAFFIADDGAGARLWTTDGAEAGTRALPDLNAAGDDRLGNLTIDHRRGRVYFTADDGVHGLELWTSNGTDAGTRLLADVWPGDGSGLEVAEVGSPSVRPALTIVNSRLYFLGRDATVGRELRVIDLCPADFNNDGAPGVQDVFDFLGAYFGQSDRADLDGSGAVGLEDVFEFLRAWFTGC